jgi:hypothetical protein
MAGGFHSGAVIFSRRVQISQWAATGGAKVWNEPETNICRKAADHFPTPMESTANCSAFSVPYEISGRSTHFIIDRTAMSPV